MRKIVMLFAATGALSAAVLSPTAADASGCYRLGLTGYHWYGFCLGPDFLYPHERVCRHGNCWYR
jgi:hypothetical protein